MKTVIVALAVALAIPAVVAADVIRLKNGRVIEVEGWRDAGDSIEFAAGGGVVRIPKSEVDKIDGRPRQGDFRMYSSGVSASAPVTGAAAVPADAVSQMRDLLGQGDGLFDQATLSGPEKVGALRRLGERWRQLEVPDALRDAHDKGRLALQSGVDAFDIDSTEPGAKARIDKAREEVKAVMEELKKLAPPPAS
ncbi:MAG: hypothetical protein ACREMB_02350 [Candidatus Rokuibacteriota bacterium]